jgi:protein-glutamine gamma-glutamyltransferase
VNALKSLEAWKTALVRFCVVVGLCSFVLLGLEGVRMSLAALAIVAAFWAMRHRPHHAEAWKVASALVSVATLMIPLLFDVAWSTAGMGLLVYLQVHRARTGSDAADDRLALLFALLMVLLASGDSRSPWLGLMLLCLVGVLPVALLVLQLYEVEAAHGARREPLGQGRRSLLLGLLGPASVLCTAAFFLVIPRLNAEVLAEYGKQDNVSGFSGELQLGELGEIKNNFEIVLRAEVTDHRGASQRGPFYFRGVSLDVFDGKRWYASESSVHPVRADPPTLDEGVASPGQLRVKVLMEPFGTDSSEGDWTGVPLFAPRDVESVYTNDAVWQDGRDGYRFGSEPRRREYVVYTRPPLQVPGTQDRPSARVLATGLQLPDMDPRVAELASQVVGDAEEPWAKVALLEQYLHDSYDYTLVPEVVDVDQPLTVFLFDSRRGHCEYFATALAVLLRHEGIPSRIVNGFYTDEFNAVGDHVVARQSHAHSWVEGWIGGRWIRLDATPAGVTSAPPGGLSSLVDAMEASWYGVVVDYDLASQLGGVRAVGRAFSPGVPDDVAPGLSPEAVGGGVMALGAGAVFVALMALLRRLVGVRSRRVRLEGVEAVHAKARKLVSRRGWSPPEALPPVEAARWVQERAGPEAGPLEELAWMHYRSRYLGDGGSMDAARRLLGELSALPRRPR